MCRTVIIILLACVCRIASAQSFSHAMGATALWYTYAAGYGISYTPRYDFSQLGDEATLSVGIPATGVLSFSSLFGGTLGLDLPLTLDLNLGHASSSDSEVGFGGFAGVGFGYSVLSGEDLLGRFVNKAYDPVLHGGLRFQLHSNDLGIRFSLLTNMYKGYYNVFSLGVFTNL